MLRLVIIYLHQALLPKAEIAVFSFALSVALAAFISLDSHQGAGQKAEDDGQARCSVGQGVFARPALFLLPGQIAKDAVMQPLGKFRLGQLLQSGLHSQIETLNPGTGGTCLQVSVQGFLAARTKLTVEL